MVGTDVIVYGLSALLAGAVMFFVGSMLSPHAKAYKVQAQTWQGQYSGLKKQLVEIQGNIDDQDPIIALGKSLGLDKRTMSFIKPIAENWIKTQLPKYLPGAQGSDSEKSSDNWR